MTRALDFTWCESSPAERLTDGISRFPVSHTCERRHRLAATKSAVAKSAVANSIRGCRPRRRPETTY